MSDLPASKPGDGPRCIERTAHHQYLRQEDTGDAAPLVPDRNRQEQEGQHRNRTVLLSSLGANCLLQIISIISYTCTMFTITHRHRV